MMRTIEIDIEVHKRIEGERRGFEEPETQILRRLLGIPEENSAISSTSSEPEGVAGKQDWSSGTLTLKHGTRLEMHYGGRRLVATIDDGAILFEGERFKAPSPAAIRAVELCGGPSAARNGWNDWHIVHMNGTKRSLSSLR